MVTKPKGQAKPKAKAKAKPRAARKKGRPTAFSQAIADKICARLIAPESLRSICRDESMPGKTTVLRWLDEREDFRTQYARAREQQADSIFDDILDIADDAANDWMERAGKEGDESTYELNGEHIQRTKLRIDARKWMLGKLAPKRYGDKVALTGEGGGPVSFIVETGVPRSDD